MYQCTLLSFHTPFSLTYSFSKGPSVHVPSSPYVPPMISERQRAASAPAVGGHVDHSLHHGAFAKFAFLQPLSAMREEFADALLSEIHTLLSQLDRRSGAVREEGCGFATHAFADVVAIRLLEALDGLGVFQQRDLLPEGRKFRFEDRDASVVVDDAAVGDYRVGGGAGD